MVIQNICLFFSQTVIHTYNQPIKLTCHTIINYFACMLIINNVLNVTDLENVW